MNNSTTFPTDNALTDAGAFSLADSFYGTFDQGGNVWEWNDAVLGSARGLRGGAFYYEGFLRASFRFSFDPALEVNNVGFRVAIVPEPSVIGFMALGIAMLAWKRK